MTKHTNGISYDWLRNQCWVIRHKIMDPNSQPGDEEDDRGMAAVVVDAIRLDGLGAEEKQQFKADEAVMRFRNIHRHIWGAPPEEDLAAIPPREYAAWRGVAFWLVYACQCEDEQDAASWIDRIIETEQQRIADVSGSTRDASGPARLGSESRANAEAQGKGGQAEKKPAVGYKDPGDPAQRKRNGHINRSTGLFEES